MIDIDKIKIWNLTKSLVCFYRFVQYKFNSIRNIFFGLFIMNKMFVVNEKIR